MPRLAILVDECISINTRSKHISSEFTESIKVLGQGVPDDQVLQYAIDEKKVILTNDKRLIIQSLEAGKPTLYRDMNLRGKKHDLLICAVPIPKIKLVDPVTTYNISSGKIILP